MPPSFQCTRREAMAAGFVSACGTLVSSGTASSGQRQQFRICAFEKFLQDLSYDELADVIAELGFVGIEATVRKKGHVLPERVEEDLPKLVEALKKRDLEVTVMASDVVNAGDPQHQRVLRTAAGLGIKHYRMGYYRYDLKKPVLPQLDEIRGPLNELAAFNKELGISAVYQNHAAATFVGATLWDIAGLLQKIPKEQIGLAFDIRHATAESGLSWPTLYNVVKPHIAAVFVKDFVWGESRPQNVPLGEGRIDPKFFRMIKADGFDGPISLHVEYLDKEGTKANIDALRRDLKTLEGWLN